MNGPFILPAVKCSISSVFAIVPSRKEYSLTLVWVLCDFYGAFVIPSEVPVECEGDFFVDGEILHKDLKIMCLRGLMSSD